MATTTIGATIQTTAHRTHLTYPASEIIESGIDHPDGALVRVHVVECACMPGWARGAFTAERARAEVADHNFARHGAHHPRFCRAYHRHDGPCPTEQDETEAVHQ